MITFSLMVCGLLSATEDERLRRVPLAAQIEQQAGDTLFELLSPSQTGVEFVNPIDTNHPQKYLYVGGFAAGGIAIGDLNNDGLLDLFFTNGPRPNRLYLQTSQPTGFRFEDVTARIPRLDGGQNWGAGATLVDIDNDGDLDVYVCNYDAPNELFVNQSTAAGVKFVEMAKAFGLDLVDASFLSAFCDYDLDGDLDVFVVGYQYIDPAGRPSVPPVVERNGKYFMTPEFRKYYGVFLGASGKPVFTNVGRADYLLQSNVSQAQGKSIRFTNVTSQAGISGLGVGNSAAWWDYNQDGWPDLYIANDFKVADQLYRNNGNGTFTDVIRESFPHTTWFSMGSEVGDVNNDGLLDLFVTDMAGTNHYRSKVTMGEMSVNRRFLATAEPRQFMRNALFINTGTARFLEAAHLAGLANSDWSWAAKLADFDNDGLLDVYITNGAARMFNHSDHRVSEQQKVGKTQWDLWESTGPRREENLAFRNLGELQFDDVSREWGLMKQGMSYAAAYGDLDNDGDLDLVVANLDEPVSLYRNRSAPRNRVKIRLVGTASNRQGIGAVVRVRTRAGIQVRQLSPSMGFLSCNEPTIHFGLGKAERIEELSVQWPSGVRQVWNNVESNAGYTIVESKGHMAPVPQASEQLTQFAPSKDFPALRHRERPYDDYARQPLLPYKHSQLGPGLAVGDIDGDGDSDFYLSRAQGSRRAVYVNQGGGRLGVTSVDTFASENAYEDMGALFLDVDRDGDQDLFVVSGGVECAAGGEELRDRLYLNDGTGSFAAVDPMALPSVRDSGSVVCGADFDRDGDLDLFVGGRVIPGSYPVTPASRLLLNHSTAGNVRMEAASEAVAPGLRHTGLVTSALWSDVDADGWIDLLVAHEWGPVKLFRNEPATASSRPGSSSPSSRSLVDRTREAGLHTRLGWWNGIASRDLDNDGDVDYVVTNFGLNTKYHASPSKPELLYYGDFDGSGSAHLVEAKFEQERCFPRRGLSCSSHAMPFVREKMKTFHNFGLATLQEIYTAERLQRSLRLEANELQSGVLFNETDAGHIRFRFVPLPVLAQISPVFGVALEDFDGDGWTDCFLAQNFFSPQLETGRMDSGLSLLLRGRPPGTDQGPFDAVGPRESGIMLAGDAKSVAVTDFNEDGWPDVLVGINDSPLVALETQPHPRHRLLQVRLSGPAGNLAAVGARVTVHFAGNRSRQTAEVCAGGGYLSQSWPQLSFGCGSDRRPQHVEIRWPNGSRSTHALRSGQFRLSVSQP